MEKNIKQLNTELEVSNKWLKELNDMSAGINALNPGANLREYVLNKLVEKPEVNVVLFSDYDVEKKTLIANCYKMKNLGIFAKAVKLLGKEPKEIVTRVSAEQYKEITKKSVVKHDSLTELSFGDIPSFVNAGIKKLLGVDYFFTLTCISEGELFGYTILGIKKDTKELSVNYLEALSNIISEALRREKNQKMIIEKEAKYRTLVETTPGGIWSIDANGKTTFVNESMAKMLGYEVFEMLGKELFYFMDKEAEKLAKMQMARRAQGIKEQHDFEFTRKDGTKIYVSIDTAPLKDEKDNFIGALAVVTDMTEHKKLEEQVLQVKKMDALGTLTGGIAHDFNNMLGVIIGYSDITLKLAGKEQKIQDGILEIKKTAERAAALTAQLLAFSRKTPHEKKEISLNTSLKDIKKMLERIIGEDVEFKVLLEPALNNVNADRGQVDQVIINLVTNAKDSMPEGGKILIKTENISLNEEDVKKFPNSRAGEFVCMTVSDTGSGMSSETISRLFEPFFTTKPFGKGAGLGLSVIYGIINQQDGWINVLSAPGKGTEVKVYLPAIKIKEKQEEKIKKERFEGALEYGDGQKIILVEDEEIIRSMLAELLIEKKYKVFQAANAAEALKIFEAQKGKFELLFSDSVMPGMKGLDLAKKLKKINPEIKVIISSGYLDDKSDILDVKESGFVFLPKPYEISVLFATVAKVLGKDGSPKSEDRRRKEKKNG